ncbi:MAG: tetratricopeptide repeat protein, partial [Anaerolineae bacterium]|nr:tetratricopeptide repeat protein [Anaerolineae bacterium]
MSLLNAAPRILVAVVKHRIKLAVGEEALQGISDAVAETLGDEVEAQINRWLNNDKFRKQIDEAAKSADACFREQYTKNTELVDLLLGMALAGSPEIEKAIEPYNRQKLLGAIKSVLAQNLPKIPKQTRATAAKKYLDCLEDALVTIDDMREQVTTATVREIRPLIEDINRRTKRIDRTTKKTAEGVEELLRRTDQPHYEQPTYEPVPVPDPAIIPERDLLPPGDNLKVKGWTPNANFVGREADLKKIAQCLLHSANGNAMAVTAAMGAGGIGKTQLAIEFAYRYGRFFHGVHWLSAISDRLDPEIAACGYAMNLPDFPDKQDAQIERVLAEWAKSAPRLIIVDNAENQDVLKDWLPRLQGHRVLITSRRGQWPAHWGVVAHRLDVLTADESRELLRRLAPHLTSAPDAELDMVGEKLGYLPLALDLAGNYMQYRRMTPAAYLELLDKQKTLVDSRLFTTWAKEQGILSPTDHDLNVYATFDLSWQRLTSDAPKRLLMGCGYLAPNTPIPLELLTALFESDDDPAESVDMALGKLDEVGLMNRKEDGLPTIHPLIAEFARLQAGEEEDTLAVLADKMARMGHKATGTGIPADFAPIRAHIERLAQQAGSASNMVATALWNSLGYHLHLMLADYGGARVAFENVLRILPEDDSNCGKVVNNLGSVLQAMGDYAGAKEHYERALRIDEAAFGPDHPDVATDVNNIGSLFRVMGDYAGAKLMYERVVTILPENHPNFSSALNNLGSVLHAMGDYARAKAYFERALRIDEAAFGPDHPSVARDVNNLGSVLQAMGDYARAKEHYERALRIDEVAFGPDHPRIASRVNNLGMVVSIMGDYVAAKEHYERALRIDEAAFGPDHPDVARDVNNLGDVLQSMGDYARAKAY